ncbi:MAG TPA: nucleotidyltransferase domain-containing protein [Thermoanaerobaculia bacterium]|nr:nucleotidyltransferase domain-containing protein [Thermoanaerobaculia bacterium]
MTPPDDRLQERIRELTLTCQEVLLHGTLANVQAVFLYGSALGEGFRPDSDVDIAVLDRSDKRLTWAEQARLMDLLERTTGQGIDLRMLRDSPLSHQVDILENGIRIWTGDPAEADHYSHEVFDSWHRQAHLNEEEWISTLRRLGNSARS